MGRPPMAAHHEAILHLSTFLGRLSWLVTEYEEAKSASCAPNGLQIMINSTFHSGDYQKWFLGYHVIPLAMPHVMLPMILMRLSGLPRKATWQLGIPSVDIRNPGGFDVLYLRLFLIGALKTVQNKGIHLRFGVRHVVGVLGCFYTFKRMRHGKQYWILYLKHLFFSSIRIFMHTLFFLINYWS